jgi:hypothetical protein
MEGNKTLNVPVALSQSYCTGGGIRAAATLDVAVERMLYAQVYGVLTVSLFTEITTMCKIRGKNS